MLKQDHYALLGVPREADAEAIERACASALSVTSDSAKRVRLRHARDTLCSPERRTTYDRSLRTIPKPPSGIGGRSASAPRPALVQTKRRGPLYLGVAALAVALVGAAYAWNRHKSATMPAVSATLAPTVKPQALRAPAAAHATAPRQPGAASAGAAPDGINPEALSTNAAPSVLLIETLNPRGIVAHRASAVVIGPEVVITHCPLVQYAAAVRVRSGSNEYTAMADTTDTVLELCSLRVPGLSAPAALRGSAKSVQVGQTVFALGAAQGAQRAVVQGKVSALRQLEGVTLIQTSAAISPGAAGGGLFDGEGRLIGITTYQHKLGPGQNLALPVDLLETLRNR